MEATVTEYWQPDCLSYKGNDERASNIHRQGSG